MGALLQSRAHLHYSEMTKSTFWSLQLKYCHQECCTPTISGKPEAPYLTREPLIPFPPLLRLTSFSPTVFLPFSLFCSLLLISHSPAWAATANQPHCPYWEAKPQKNKSSHLLIAFLWLAEPMQTPAQATTWAEQLGIVDTAGSRAASLEITDRRSWKEGERDRA